MFVVSPCLVFVGKYFYLVLHVLLGFVDLFPYFSWIRQVSTPMIALRLIVNCFFAEVPQGGGGIHSRAK